MELNKIDTAINNYYSNYDKYIKVPVEISNTIENFRYINKKDNKILYLKKIIITILGISTMAGGIVFAKEYVFKNFNLSKGIDTAIQNGYIYENENNNQTIIDSNTNIINKDFFMDDTNISAKFLLYFSEEIKTKIKIENLKGIELDDLVITDENNKILYCKDEMTLEKFCKNNNLNFDVLKNNNYIYGGLNEFIDLSIENNAIELTYNIYAGNLEDSYPKSKHLNYNFSRLKLIEKEENTSDYKLIDGNWNINIDVPEIMYNRNTINYKVVSCSSNNIDVHTAKVSETGFEFGCIMHKMEVPNEVRIYKENINRQDISIEQRMEYTDKFLETGIPLNPIVSTFFPEIGETIENCTYIKNENNRIFRISSNPGRKQNSNFINGVDDFEFYETFDLTKYDITDELEINIVFYDKVIKLKLQKN